MAIIFSVITATVNSISGCTVSQAVAAKSGATLWGENCLRCHNTPSPTDFSDAQWETIGMHMKLRANLTNDEIKKVVEFLKSAN
ncbi:MAG: cytochrome c [Chitinophagaceae bacterium]|nr:MAG: cytochrome c [Chitinophagaceae bacterium]